MPVQNKTTLKGYFEDGDKPTGSNFTDLVDSLQHVSADTLQTLTDGTSISWDLSIGGLAAVTLGGNHALANPSSLAAGIYMLKVIQDGTGGRVLTYGTTYKFAGGVVPILSSGAGQYDILSFFCDGTYMNCIPNYNFS
jgi:hypothetical protein